MSGIPTISVTKDDDEEVHDHDHVDNGDFDVSVFSDVLTDIEDMDSNDDEEVGRQFFKINSNSKRGSKALTDIEDYNDSCSDEEISTKYPVLKLSLQEFLSHGLTEERTSNNQCKGTCDMIAGKSLGLEMFSKVDDCPTDYDNYSISSDEEHCNEKSVCVDFSLMHLENKNTEQHVEHGEASDDEFSKSDCFDYFNEAARASGYLSEDEVIEMSGSEQEMIVEVNSSDEDDILDQHTFPTLNVKFSSEDTKRKGDESTQSHFLHVSANCEESLTDIEKIDLSAAEDSGDEDSMPMARAIVVDNADNSNTDVEDIYLNEPRRFSAEIENVNRQYIPPPHREMVLIREDKNGDPITNVVAMENDFRFGLADSNHDDLLTDVEDISSAVDDYNDFSKEETAQMGSSFENEVVLTSENIKPTTHKRNEYLDNITDTEEIFVTGSVRRKRNKLKTQNKSKSKQNNLGNKTIDNFESDESNISSRSMNTLKTDNMDNSNENKFNRKHNHAHSSHSMSNSAEMYTNDSFTVVHEKCVNTFNVNSEKNFIKGLKECLETHTDVEYVEEDQAYKN